MTFDLAQMIADREAGTPGEWFINGPTWNQIVWTDNETRLCFMTHSNGLNDARDEANARRIARVPAMEAEIIRLTARVAALEDALTRYVAQEVGYMTINNLGDPNKQHMVIRARAALSTPTEEPKT